jgi:beta-barrel assembly-enhancing protease
MSDGAKFAGFVMTGDVPGGRAGAELTVVPNGVVARTRDHGEFRLPFAEATFDRGGASGRMTFVRSRLSDLIAGTEDPAFVAELRENADAATLTRLEEAFAGARARSSAATRNGWKLFFALAGLAALGFFAIREPRPNEGHSPARARRDHQPAALGRSHARRPSLRSDEVVARARSESDG